MHYVSPVPISISGWNSATKCFSEFLNMKMIFLLNSCVLTFQMKTIDWDCLKQAWSESIFLCSGWKRYIHFNVYFLLVLYWLKEIVINSDTIFHFQPELSNPVEAIIAFAYSPKFSDYICNHQSFKLTKQLSNKTFDSLDYCSFGIRILSKNFFLFPNLPSHQKLFNPSSLNSNISYMQLGQDWFVL